MKSNDILALRCPLIKLIDEELRKVGSGDTVRVSLEDQRIARQKAIARYQAQQTT